MKLFVWNDPYKVNYGGLCLYVIAKNVTEARKLAKENCVYGCFGGFNRQNMGKTVVSVDNEEPTSVHELPYAECYHWEE